MRVLFVSQEFPPETGWGGIGTYVASVGQALSATGVDVHVLSVVAGQPVSTRSAGGVTVHRRPLPVVRGPARFTPEAWSRLWLSLRVAREVSRLEVTPDVIECPDWMAEGFALGIRRTFPLVTRLHSSSHQIFPYSGQGGQSAGIDGWLTGRLEDAAIRRSNVVLSTRANFNDVARRIGLDARGARFSPHIVRLPAERPYPESSETPRVTFVGRLESRKAPEVVLRAVPHVLAAVPGAKFVFVGRSVGDPAAPSSAASLGRTAEQLGVAHAVELVGGLHWEGVADELARASVGVFPSRWECFPNVTAEAAAIGRPVIVSSISGFREMVVDGVTGTVVPSEEPEAWARAIIELLLSPQRARTLGRAGSELIRQVSDANRIVALTIAAYEDAIKRWRQGERVGLAGRRSRL